MTAEAPFREIVLRAIGGGWGNSEPTDGFSAVRVIRGTDFRPLELGETATVPGRFEKGSKIPQRKLEVGDVVLEISGGSAASGQSTGRSLFYSEKLSRSFGNSPVIPASFCRLVRFDESKVIPRYAFFALQDMYLSGRAALYERASTGISNFSFETFLDAETIMLPPIDHQRRIAALLGDLDDLRAQAAEARAVREALVPLLMTGRAVPGSLGERR